MPGIDSRISNCRASCASSQMSFFNSPSSRESCFSLAHVGLQLRFDKFVLCAGKPVEADSLVLDERGTGTTGGK